MWPNNLIDVHPGPSSDSSTTELEHYIDKSSLHLGFFDVQSPVIRTTKDKSWSEVADQVLQEDHALWKRLADL